MKTIVAFANTAGGILLIGVEDRSRDVRGVADLLDEEKRPVTARKDDAPATDQAAITNVLAVTTLSGGGGLIQTTSG